MANSMAESKLHFTAAHSQPGCERDGRNTKTAAALRQQRRERTDLAPSRPLVWATEPMDSLTGCFGRSRIPAAPNQRERLESTPECGGGAAPRRTPPSVSISVLEAAIGSFGSF